MQTELSTILAHFYPDLQLISAKALGEGNINQSFDVHLKSGSQDLHVVVQQINQSVFKEPDALMKNWVQVCRWLEENAQYDLEVPTPVYTSEHQSFFRDELNYIWRVVPFFENTIAFETVDSPDQAFEIAHSIGSFLQALKSKSAEGWIEPIPGFHDTHRRWLQFEKNLQTASAERVREAHAALTAIQGFKPDVDLVHKLKLRGDLSIQLTHNDSKSGNVLLDSQSGLARAVIDLDTVMPGSVLSDFGDLVRSMASNMHETDQAMQDDLYIRQEILNAIVEGFLEKTADTMRATERENLMLGAYWIIGEQALRFLSDFLAGDVYYKVEYSMQNLHRAQNQLQLYKALKELAWKPG